MRRKFIELITAILLTLVAGVFWGTWFSLSRTMHVLSSGTFITKAPIITLAIEVPINNQIRT